MKTTRSLLVLAGLCLVLTAESGTGIERRDELVPSRPLERPVSPGRVPDLLYFEREHSLSLGDKGEDRFNVSTRPPACGATALVFDHARIVYKHNRYGEAKIVRSPKAGCFICSPLVVRWYHEPTGHLDYQVHVYRRRIGGECVRFGQ